MTVFDGKVALAAPDLWHYEMCNLLAMAARRGRIGEAQALEGMELMSAMPINFHDHHGTLSRRRMLLLAARFSLSAYDAAYLELADRLQCSLLTNDDALRAAGAQLGLPMEPN
jgi:predicted nucleic acid-binding protein